MIRHQYSILPRLFRLLLHVVLLRKLQALGNQIQRLSSDTVVANDDLWSHLPGCQRWHHLVTVTWQGLLIWCWQQAVGIIQALAIAIQKAFDYVPA